MNRWNASRGVCSFSGPLASGCSSCSQPATHDDEVRDGLDQMVSACATELVYRAVPPRDTYGGHPMSGSSQNIVAAIIKCCPRTTDPTTLHTDRLLLRPFRPGDVSDALAYRNDEEFCHFLPHIPHPFTRRDAEAFVALNMSEPWERSPTFAVVLEGKVIGTVSLEIDAHSRTARIGYAIGRRWWGQGIAPEAVQAVMAWAIEAFALHRVCASTDARHVRSQRVLEKLGMQREEVRVADHVGRDGKMVDEVMYGLDAKGHNIAGWRA